MSNKSKKRNKKYAGWDAKTDDSTVLVHKVSAKPRSNFQQWLFDHKKMIRNVAIVVAVVGVITFFVVQGIMSVK